MTGAANDYREKAKEIIDCIDFSQSKTALTRLEHKIALALEEAVKAEREKLGVAATQPGLREPSPEDGSRPCGLQSLTQAESDWTLGTEWRHIKSGRLYVTVGKCRLEATAAPAVLYRGEDGTVWARDMDEFLDGRFDCTRERDQSPKGRDSALAGSIHAGPVLEEDSPNV